VVETGGKTVGKTGKKLGFPWGFSMVDGNFHGTLMGKKVQTHI